MMLGLIEGRSNGEPLPPSNDRRERKAAVSLTPRQRDVLALVAEGKSNKAIGRSLDLAVPTVKLHVTAIFAALEVSNRTEAAIAAAELGLTLVPEDA
jgi:DNA-binding NarL/FixJ family response regulator